MGKLEQEAKALRNLGRMQRAILATIASSGMIGIALVAPNALKLFKGLSSHSRFTERTKSAIQRLVDRGYLVFVTQSGKKVLRLTKKGELALELKVEEHAHKKHKQWDKRWRLIVFDIPESRRRLRARFRHLLISVGFVKLQNSVWVYPYDCEELMILMKSELRIGKEVLYAIVEKIENDSWLRKHFNLLK